MIGIFITCLILSIISIPTIIIVINTLIKKGKIRPYWVMYLSISIFISSFIMFIPYYKNIVWNQTNTNSFINVIKRVGQAIEIIIMSVHNAIRLFIVDTDFEALNSFTSDFLYTNDKLKYIAEIYRVHSVLLYIISPLFTFSIIATFVYSFVSKVALITKKGTKLYIFSELNEKMITLAESIKEKRCQAKIKIIFCNVEDKTDSLVINFVQRAKKIGAFVIKNSLEDIDLSKKDYVSLFIAGEDEYEKLDLASTLVEKYTDKENFKIYLFSNTTQSIMLQHGFMKKENAKIKFGLINEVSSVVNNEIYFNGSKIFKKAQLENNKRINIVLVGAGEYGTQMFKTLIWYCQVIGYKICFTILDKNPNCYSEYKAQFPEIDFVCGKDKTFLLGKKPNYNVEIYNDINVKTQEFLDIVSNANPSYVFVSLGDDELNLNTAIKVRELCERKKTNPIIKVSMRSSRVSDKIAKAENHKNEKYRVEPIGDIKSAYSYDCVIHTDLDNYAKEQHLNKNLNAKASIENDFWDSAYNYNSSFAKLMHIKLLVDLGILKNGENTLGRLELNELEHERWCAYMRALGYKYCSERNDLAKLHTDLIPFKNLSEEKKSYDTYIVPENL